MLKKVIQVFLFVGLLLNLAQQAESQQKKRPTKKTQSKSIPSKNLTAEEIAKKFLPSVVLIVCDDGKGKFSQGSGFFVKPGMILTNYHVIDGMVRGKIKTVFDNKEEDSWWIQKVLFKDSKNDLALLEIENTLNLDRDPPLDNWKIPALNLSESGKVTIGEKIYVLSNPQGLEGTISQGIISSGIRKRKDIELLQIDAPISSGSSGGAVLNARGEVIGIATASLSSGQNLNFAVSSLQIKTFLNQYDLKSKTLLYTKNLIDNRWSVYLEIVGTYDGGLPDTVIPKIVEKPKLTYEEITEKIIKELQGVSGTTSNIKSEIRNISFSQCTMNLKIFELYKEEDPAITSYESRLTSLKEVNLVNVNGVNVIGLEFENRLIETTEFDDGSKYFSLTKDIIIPISDEKKVGKIWIFFRMLKNECSQNFALSVNNKPSLEETTNWLSNKIEGTQTYANGVSLTYRRLRFDKCKMTMVESAFSGGFQFIYTYETNLNFLQRVKVSGNKFGKWGIWLKFNRNFDVLAESRGVRSSEKENRKKDELSIFLSDYENASRVGSAFSRVLELCSVETSEPF